MTRKKVVAAMSGGVDSSVAAALLQQKGYDVIGITLDIWPQKAERFGGCCSATAVNDAKSVCAKLGIPHYVLNFRDHFKEYVIDNFISEYSSGKTPNPCIRCNQFIKFDLLLKKAQELGAQYLATGHYAIIEKLKTKYLLKKSPDKTKDQSYFLYPMTQEVLSKVLFPVGEITKEKTRKIAHSLGLSVADKKDSQEICFIEDNDFGRFLSENAAGTIMPGPILDTEGNNVGMHRGIVYYTVGQRKGLGIPFGKPFYIVRIDSETNSLIVGEEHEIFGKELIANQIVWNSIHPKKAFKAKGKVRYSPDETDCVVTPQKDGSVKVKFKKPVRAITPGQSLVLYKNDAVFGGGIICKTH